MLPNAAPPPTVSADPDVFKIMIELVVLLPLSVVVWNVLVFQT